MVRIERACNSVRAGGGGRERYSAIKLMENLVRSVETKSIRFIPEYPGIFTFLPYLRTLTSNASRNAPTYLSYGSDEFSPFLLVWQDT
jgi:hypothetical protein